MRQALKNSLVLGLLVSLLGTPISAQVARRRAEPNASAGEAIVLEGECHNIQYYSIWLTQFVLLLKDGKVDEALITSFLTGNACPNAVLFKQAVSTYFSEVKKLYSASK